MKEDIKERVGIKEQERDRVWAEIRRKRLDDEEFALFKATKKRRI